MKTWHKVALAIVVPTVVLVPAIIIYRVVKKRKQEESLGLGGSTPKTTTSSNTQGKPNTGINVGGVNVKLDSLDTKSLIGKMPFAKSSIFGGTVPMYSNQSLTIIPATKVEFVDYVTRGKQFKNKVVSLSTVFNDNGDEITIAKLDNGKYVDYSELESK